MDSTKGTKSANWRQSHKTVLSSDRSLQLDFLKLESLVIVDQNATVNTFPGLVHTARHTMKVVPTRSHCGNRKEPGAQGRNDDWGEVVTR
jgi:hypothetical protein